MDVTVRVPSVENQSLRRLARSEYDQLVMAGVFRDERVELVFGQVVAMSPTDPAHSESTWIIADELRRQLSGRARVNSQAPFAASDDSEPEPDIYVTPSARYWKEHPTRAFLIVEVARTSLTYDRNEKAVLYGLSEVDEYWIVDQVHGLVEIRRDRQNGIWRSITTHRRGDTIAMLAFPDVELAVSEILPPT